MRATGDVVAERYEIKERLAVGGMGAVYRARHLLSRRGVAIMSSKGATPAADVWAVGAMIYEIVAGAPPFTGPTPHAVVVRACASAHAPLGDVAPEVGERLAALVERALAKNPRDRFEDAHALRDALRAALECDPDSSHAPVTMRPHAPTNVAGDTLPSVRPASTGGTSWQRIDGEGFSIALPPGWAARASSVPYVALLVIDTATEHDAVPTSIRLKREPWPGDTRSYADLGMAGISHVGHINRCGDTMLADVPAVEVDATMIRVEPSYRVLNRCAVKDGVGWVAQASAHPDRFADITPVLRAILGTPRIGS